MKRRNAWQRALCRALPVPWSLAVGQRFLDHPGLLHLTSGHTGSVSSGIISQEQHGAIVSGQEPGCRHLRGSLPRSRSLTIQKCSGPAWLQPVRPYKGTSLHTVSWFRAKRIEFRARIGVDICPFSTSHELV